jgi:hypothetical protein
MLDDHEIDRSGTAHGQLKIARRILDADELVRMTDLRPRFEKEIALKGDSRGNKNRVFLFSIDGMLDGNRIIGALFAGECLLVQDWSLERAARTAREGLADTVRLVREEFESRTAVKPASVLEQGIATEAGGRKAGTNGGDPLKTDPKLKAMLAHLIGGLPWKW